MKISSDQTSMPASRVSAAVALRKLQSQARYLFRPTDFAEITHQDPQGIAVQSALKRLSARGLIKSLSRRPSTWLIVPPEYDHYGCPPVEWWLHDYLDQSVPHYYLALLSAARFWGSSHYAHQTTQIMVQTARRTQHIGKLTLQYSVKLEISQTPVVIVNTAANKMRVTTREATLLDLLRHQSQIGGLETVARVAKDFAPVLKEQALLDALEALGQVSSAQRLGFVFHTLALNHLADVIDVWLKPRHRATLQLDANDSNDDGLMLNNRWGVKYKLRQQQLMAEI
jgi:predicted transcriptional regulator of viral defense system